MRHEGIRQVGSLLLKYKSLRAPQGAVVEAFLESVKEVCGFELKKSGVKYSPAGKTLALKFSGPLKQEVLLKQKQILVLCEKRLGAGNAPRVIV